MADRNDERDESKAAPPRAPGAGLSVPLPAVLMGLGMIAASPAVDATVIARNDSFATTPNTPLMGVSIVANDTIVPPPVNSTATIFMAVGAASHGNAFVDTNFGSPTFGQLTYYPNPGYVGTDQFSYALIETGGIIIQPPGNTAPTLGVLSPTTGVIDASNALVTITIEPAPVPTPALAPAALAGLSGLVALAAMRRRRKDQS